jgi:hypothetical protein
MRGATNRQLRETTVAGQFAQAKVVSGTQSNHFVWVGPPSGMGWIVMDLVEAAASGRTPIYCAPLAQYAN